MAVTFTLNGKSQTVDVSPQMPLLWVLRDSLGMTGTKFGCGMALCGCCTVLVDGKPVSGCLYLAVFLDGAEVVTVENLAEPGKLDPIQDAFIECGAFQCGYCTPGFIMMAKALLVQHPDPDDQQIRDYLTGNLCRCGAYPEIVNAVKMAARNNKAGSTG